MKVDGLLRIKHVALCATHTRLISRAMTAGMPKHVIRPWYAELCDGAVPGLHCQGVTVWPILPGPPVSALALQACQFVRGNLAATLGQPVMASQDVNVVCLMKDETSAALSHGCMSFLACINFRLRSRDP